MVTARDTLSDCRDGRISHTTIAPSTSNNARQANKMPCHESRTLLLNHAQSARLALAAHVIPDSDWPLHSVERKDRPILARACGAAIYLLPSGLVVARRPLSCAIHCSMLNGIGIHDRPADGTSAVRCHSRPRQTFSTQNPSKVSEVARWTKSPFAITGLIANARGAT